ncbi:MAG: ABC transporter permease [Chryseolinea sp.]
MLQNYLLTAWRNLYKNKLFSFINVFGLALSVSLAIAILAHVLDIMRYDSFHPEKEKIYRVISNIKSGTSGEWTLASTPLPLAAMLSKRDDVFDAVVSLYPCEIADATAEDDKPISVTGVFTQNAFFDVFGFDLISGSKKMVLSKPSEIVISQPAAERIFGHINVVGKYLTLGKLGRFEITGVLRKPNAKSHINFDVLISSNAIANLEANKILPARSEKWDSFEFAYTYVRLGKHHSRSDLDFELQSISSEINRPGNSGSLALRPQSLTSITPTSDDLYRDIGSGVTWGKMMAEVGVAMVIVLSACFNYTNLSIARALTRMKEIGLRKVVGATRFQIFSQYNIEAVLVAFIALFFAQIMLALLVELDVFDQSSYLSLDATSIFAMLLMTVLIGLLAGTLPAWILSSFKAVRLLKNVVSEKLVAGLTLRKILIVFQFSISLIILIFMVTFHSQFSFMAEVDPGYRMSGILSVPCGVKSYETLSTKLKQLGEVEQVSASSDQFGRYPSGRVSVSTERSADKRFDINYYFVNRDVIPVSGLTLVAGTNFPEHESAIEAEVIINEKAGELLGFKNPYDAIGQHISLQDSLDVSVSGVVRNFYNEGVGISYRPLVLRHKIGSYHNVNIVVTPGNDSLVVAKIEKAWKEIYPDQAFTYVWLKKQHDERHADMGSIDLLGFLAFMAISIASLGLLGLVVYTVETKRKEISIRKINGANVSQLILLLSRGFLMMIAISGCIGVPVAVIGGELFLMNFVNRVSVGLLNPLLSFMALFLLGLSMILTQTYYASRENPAKNLRNE